MDKAAKQRWTILLSALSATLAAVFYPLDELSESVQPVQSRPATVSKASIPVSPERDYADASGDDVSSIDPFASKGWQQPPPQPVTQAAPTTVAAPTAPPEPVGPPPLPFKFMGRLNDGGSEVVYLSKGDQTVVAHPGDVIDGMYRVTAMTRQQIEFEHVPTGDKQVLSLPSDG
ncbi:hypothetical protein E4K72_05600 [Oxalobacteraceae bacterium OM1]|nr:hypothetical protein E4K72_05600 [Oxalobacteraceae bacterium OM1]